MMVSEINFDQDFFLLSLKECLEQYYRKTTYSIDPKVQNSYVFTYGTPNHGISTLLTISLISLSKQLNVVISCDKVSPEIIHNVSKKLTERFKAKINISLSGK